MLCPETSLGQVLEQQVISAKQTGPELITPRVFVEIKLDIFTKKEENYSRQGGSSPDGYIFKLQQFHPKKKRVTICINYRFQMSKVPTSKSFEMEQTTSCLTSTEVPPYHIYPAIPAGF